MDKEIRKKYNSLFNESDYTSFINDINKSTGNRLDFRISETPLFLDSQLTRELIKAGEEIIDQIRTKEYFNKSDSAIPADLIVPNEDEHPIFLQIDFGITQNEKSDIIPQLIELQGFPSLYAYQSFLDEKLRSHFYIPENYTSYYNSDSKSSYIDIFTKTLVGECDPENVVLLEIEPDKQKTRIDFYLTEQYSKVKTVCLSKLINRGKKLFYLNNGREIPIERIYNRVIFDELLKSKIDYGFNFKDELNVTWVGHPNWFYRISKFSLPEIKSKYNPECYYLSEIDEYPSNLEDYVLKPLFSFAGSGVIIDVTLDLLNSIKDKKNYILQRKVEYLPIIETPEGKAKAEIRMMYIWNKKPVLVNNLLRTSKGKMMGVDFNKNRTWIGSNTIYHPEKFNL